MLDNNVRLLADSVLDDKQITIINQIIDDIKCEKREFALNRLAAVLGVKPKRPLYYIYTEIFGLPEYGSRNILRDLGDYIDQLVRFTLEDEKFLTRWFRKPLGPNIEKLKPFLDQDLYNNLKLFNKIYTDAKHKFIHDEDLSVFYYEDAVYMIFITKNLASELLKLSQRARDYNNQVKHIYIYGPVD